MNYWLLKSEPAVFGIDDLAARPGQTDTWDGVRNYQARNLLRDRVRTGDQALFYHSRCPTPGIVGLIDIVRAGYPDPSACDPRSPYFDPRATLERPRWFAIDVRYRRHLRRVIALSELRRHATGALADWPLLRRGNRLSVLPVTPQQWRFVLALETDPAS